MRTFIALAASAVLLVACGESEFTNNACADVSAGSCIEVDGGDSTGLIEAVNTLIDNTTIILGPGTYEFDNQVTVRGASGVSIIGQGMNETILDFGAAANQVNGIDVIGDNFLVQDLQVLDAPKDGIRVEESDGVTYRRIKASWSEPELSTNGAYGIYPVRSSNVLVEDSVAERSSDAGLYVGQCINVIVRDNEVRDNVAGLEIENTQYADVYGNYAHDNTGGLVVFDLPGNPVVGRDVRIRDNRIENNNTTNFAPGGTVALIPAGTGTFAMASRRVEIVDNTYIGNNTGDIALISGLVVDADPAVWELPVADLIGDTDDLGLLPGATEGTVTNYRSENIVIAGNTHMDSGTDPDREKDFGLLIAAAFRTAGGGVVSSVFYDTIGESVFDPENAANNSNDNHICVGDNTMANGFTSLNMLPKVQGDLASPLLTLDEAPFAPFDCTALAGGEIVVPDFAN